MITKVFLTLFLLLNLSVLAGSEPVLIKVIEEFLEKKNESTPVEKARYISTQLDLIGKEALNRGMDLSNYKIAVSVTGALSFHMYPVWEGQDYGIPLTLFIYVWPAEGMALKIDPYSKWYASDIHSHPIDCSLTVLRGALVQENYAAIAHSKKVKLTDSECLIEGALTCDFLDRSSIHRLVCRDPLGEPAVSLHAYGLATAQEVHDCFRNTYEECSFELQK